MYGEKDVVVHIRRGLDFGRNGWVLPFDYYDRALSSFAHIGRVHVCGIEIDDDVRQYFSRFNATFHDLALFEQFRLIQKFRRIVLSNETTAWWAAFLSNAEFIVAPRAINGNGYAFTGFRGVDLHMRERRYGELDVPAFARLEWAVASRMSGAALYRSGQDLIIAAPGHQAVRMTAGPSATRVARWLVDHERLSSVDLDPDMWQIIDTLVHSGLVQLWTRYLQEVSA